MMIYRKNAIEGVKELFACADIGNDECDITYMLENLPSADAVVVVRCKDCKYSHMTYDGRCKYCDKWEEDGEALYLDGDFYCAYGERKNK